MKRAQGACGGSCSVLLSPLVSCRCTDACCRSRLTRNLWLFESISVCTVPMLDSLTDVDQAAPAVTGESVDFQSVGPKHDVKDSGF